MPGRTRSADVDQPVTDDSIQVRHLSHYQFSWTAQDAGEGGVFTLQLVLDQGAWGRSPHAQCGGRGGAAGVAT